MLQHADGTGSPLQAVGHIKGLHRLRAICLFIRVAFASFYGPPLRVVSVTLNASLGPAWARAAGLKQLVSGEGKFGLKTLVVFDSNNPARAVVAHRAFKAAGLRRSRNVVRLIVPVKACDVAVAGAVGGAVWQRAVDLG